MSESCGIRRVLILPRNRFKRKALAYKDGGFKFSEKGMNHKEYIRIKVISFPTLFLLIRHMISYREIYNKYMLGLTKTGNLS